VTDNVFSIIVPTYNRSALLARALDSVLAQSFPHFSVIVIDDCSTDATPEVVQDYLGDPRFTYHRNETQGGTNVSRNIGYDLAEGLLITYLDDDDELVPTALEVAYGYHCKLGAGGRHWLLFDWVTRSDGKVDNVVERREGYLQYCDILAGRIKGNFWCVYSREIIENPRIRHDERLISDEGQMYLAAWKTQPPYYVPHTLYLADDTSPARQTDAMAMGKRNKEQLANLEVHLGVFGDDLLTYCPSMLGRKLSRLGYLYALNRRPRKSFVSHLRALRYARSRYGAKLALLSLFALLKNVTRTTGERAS